MASALRGLGDGVMSPSESVRYVLRHAWLWPLRFWMRPLVVIAAAKEQHAEFEAVFCGFVGGALYGTIAGGLVWAWSGNPNAVWLGAIGTGSAVAGASAGGGVVAGAGAFVIVGAVAVAVAVAGAFAGAVVVAGAGVIVVAGAVAGSDAGTGVGDDADTIAGAGGDALGIASMCAFGIATGISFKAWVLPAIAIVGTLVLCLSLWELISRLRFDRERPDWASITLYFLCLFALPAAPFGLFPVLRVDEAATWGLVLGEGIGFGASSSFYRFWSKDPENPYGAYASRNRRQRYRNQGQYLTVLWIFCSTLALAAWGGGFLEGTLTPKLHLLALFLITTPLVYTGLPLYPLVALFSLYQSRSRRVAGGEPGQIEDLVALVWQTFAYPLPGTYRLLRNLAMTQGVQTSLRLLQRLQLETLQDQTAARAALRLAADPHWALPWCGEVAVTTNTATLAHLGLAGPAAEAVAVLATKVDKEDEQPLRFWFREYPHRRQAAVARFRRSLKGAAAEPAVPGLDALRASTLVKRLEHAQGRLGQCADHHQSAAFTALLDALYATAGAATVAELEALSLTFPTKPERLGWGKDGAWLRLGWNLLQQLEQTRQGLSSYRTLTDPTSRHDWLQRLAKNLEQPTWSDLPSYWTSIGAEIAAHWVELLRNEARQAREWLRLEVRAPERSLRTGYSQLRLEIHNPTGVDARGLSLEVIQTEPGLHCTTTHQEFQSILERRRSLPVQLPIECEQPGEYRIEGRVQARDLDDNPVTEPFSWRLLVGKAGRPYQPPDYAPYVTGAGLGDDRTFTGRKSLLKELHALWRQPGGKPAVLLVGQRRIGKTSLLNKVQRDGLESCGLLPLIVSAQEWEEEYGLLRDTTTKMAKALDLDPPALDPIHPRPGFKGFVTGQGSALTGRRFLLMLDETEDLFSPQKHFGTLPGFLRSLMQDHDYPVLMLFCGTYRLKPLIREYDSIFFNTVQEIEVGYLTAPESEELLQKPVQGLLQFDPPVLREAYTLTHGQPLLLQLLGETFIRNFDAQIEAAKARDDYVDLNDLEQAATTLARRDNPAFTQHWQDCDASIQRLLSTLAWATNETDRRQLDQEGILRAMVELRLTPAGRLGGLRAPAYEALQRLVEEQVLVADGPTYRYAVPLYRRWVAWRHDPEGLRQAGKLGME
jgi:hypothetical protein